jgi:hypothetical protein
MYSLATVIYRSANFTAGAAFVVALSIWLLGWSRLSSVSFWIIMTIGLVIWLIGRAIRAIVE